MIRLVTVRLVLVVPRHIPALCVLLEEPVLLLEEPVLLLEEPVLLLEEPVLML
ncbi:MAG: hypothetical protein HZT40_16155 [Candidatus Thiothrix singaporensis]|uniref:Uncharacterized protein n=1 Tax=Candidatus Thiothrix singaporensis TaxID=2799669 RepID=A0A7L6AUW3_9GAMM|nr:MAG: hypothetical protein HZT40_16155 [Candidatus Thiothrix singaporensis]